LVDPAADLSVDEVRRYSRHLIIPDVGMDGQKRLKNARVLCVGAGGLGSPALMYLAAAGVGTLGIVEFDVVDESNLQRQIIHDTPRIGQDKVASARHTLNALNPECQVHTIAQALEGEALVSQVAGADVVLDCSDNFATRFAVNAACVRARKPLVSGAAIRLEGQVATFSGQPGGPCYQCLYPRNGDADETCSANGILAPLVGIIGSIQATEAIKIISGIGEPLFGRLLRLDAGTMEWRGLRLTADPACPVCSLNRRAAAKLGPLP